MNVMNQRPMTESEVVELMKSSKTEEEWNFNCDLVKSSNSGNYPSFWFVAIVVSGVMRNTIAKWNYSTK